MNVQAFVICPVETHLYYFIIYLCGKYTCSIHYTFKCFVDLEEEVRHQMTFKY